MLLPTWGVMSGGVGKGYSHMQPFNPPVVFTRESARVYGRFLGKRYRNNRNVIWVLGGDCAAEEQEQKEIRRAMAQGIKQGDRGRHLMTYHPGRGTSSKFWPAESRLDFHVVQSGHSRRDAPNYEMVAQDYSHQPTRPVMDGEPRYEDLPIGNNPENGWCDEFDVRQAACWALFAGAHGHAYGTNSLYQVYKPGTYKPDYHARTDWRKEMDLPGAFQMQHVRALIESRPVLQRVPDQSLLADPGERGAHQRATRGRNYLMVYTPRGAPVTVEMGRISGQTVVAWWYNPRDGAAQPNGTFPNAGRRTFPAPGTQVRGNDWVLVLDDAAAKFAHHPSDLTSTQEKEHP